MNFSTHAPLAQLSTRLRIKTFFWSEWRRDQTRRCIGQGAAIAQIAVTSQLQIQQIPSRRHAL
jgi:hypothetical protein